VQSIRVRYDQHGRSVQRRRLLRIVLIVLAIVILLWLVGYTLFNIGGMVPGSGEGTPPQTP
jgi:hypothetical protein